MDKRKKPVGGKCPSGYHKNKRKTGKYNKGDVCVRTKKSVKKPKIKWWGRSYGF